MVRFAVQFLTDQVHATAPGEVTNVRSLKTRVKAGDVLLISGHSRISNIVKVLTTSQWSHVVLFVGDRRDLLSDEEVRRWRAQYGMEALRYLYLDADPVRGVHLKPLDETIGSVVRHCRASALAEADTDKVVESALSQLGKRYDITHIFRLLLFFALPWGILPSRMRKFVTEFTLSESDTICSRALSEAFDSVGYPIRPMEIVQERRAFDEKALGFIAGIKNRGRTATKLLMGGRVRAAVHRLTDERYLQIVLKGTRYITPADYDLSHYFSIIKDPSDLAIDYRRAKTLVPVGRSIDEE